VRRLEHNSNYRYVVWEDENDIEEMNGISGTTFGRSMDDIMTWNFKECRY
jgi:hypothetical protein